MKRVILPVCVGALLLAGAPIRAEDTELKEKISDVSPDKKFAVRTSYDPAIDDGSKDEISNEAIKSVDVIALADKKVVASLVEKTDDSDIGSIQGKIVWSSDSKWFAYGMSQGHRVTETSVERWKGDKFEALNTDEMTVPAGGDPRNQYVTPMRWLKPGTLVLEQVTIFFYGKGESTYEFTVRFKDDGKFQVLSRKKVKNKDE